MSEQCNRCPISFMTSSFLPFFHSLLQDGTIPFDTYGFSAASSKDDCEIGNRDTISSFDFVTNCIQEKLIDIPIEEGAYLELYNLYYKITFTYLNNEWRITRFKNLRIR